ncbi:MAG: fibronectin type III domain-containing protein [Gemmatimonadales bacterium]|nr:fibronectin type III domain-containing protein [Gemmatimonadales bacterium]
MPRINVTLVVLAGLAWVGCDSTKQPLEPAIQAAGAAGPKVTAPSNTSAVAVSESRIDVSWQDNSSNETGFEVHRSTAGPNGAFTLLESTGAGITTFGDTGLSPARQYCYKVRAFKTAGKTSDTQFSPTACATTLASAPPAAPSGLNADVYPFQIVLFWSDNSNDEDGWKIERCRGVVCSDADFTVIATKAPNYPWYSDYDLEGETTYTYRVRAFNSAGDSAPTNQASATACFVEVSEDGTYVCKEVT